MLMHWSRAPSVSYTHLGIVDEEPDEGDEDVENSDDAVVMRVGNMMLIVTPVSYTHLQMNTAFS